MPTGSDRLQSEVFETANAATTQAIRLLPATFGSDKQGLEIVQRSRFKSCPRCKVRCPATPLTGVAGHRCISGCSRWWAWWAAEGLVVLGRVEDQFAEELAGLGVDGADVEVGDQDEDALAGVLAAQADVA